MTNYSEKQESPHVTIRLASSSEALALAKLRYDFRSSDAATYENEELFLQRCSLWMQERLRDGDRWKCWIAVENQQLIGNLWAQLIEKIPNPTSEPECHLYFTNFYLREDRRGKGIGSELFTTALNWSRTKNVHAIILWPSERSEPFYLRHGFHAAHRILELNMQEKLLNQLTRPKTSSSSKTT